MKLLHYYLNRLFGRESTFEFDLLNQPVILGISARRELKRAHEITIESALVEKMREHVQPGDIIYDIGANIGLISILLALYPKSSSSTVHSFEPEPRNFHQLQHNIELNQLVDRVHTHQLALGEATGEVQLHIRGTAGEGRHSIASSKGATGTISVPVMTLNEFATGCGEHPSVLKIDVEGAEGQVLAGTDELMAKHPPREIFLEIHSKGDGFRMPNGETIHDWLEGHRYSLQWKNQRGSGEHRHYRHEAQTATGVEQPVSRAAGG